MENTDPSNSRENNSASLGQKPPVKDDEKRSRRPHVPSASRLIKALFSFVLILFASFFLFFYHYPVVISLPGPTFNVVGQTPDRESLIKISGSPTYKTSGKLLMTTVSTLGGPGGFVNGVDLISSYFDPTATVSSYEDLYPKDLTEKDATRLANIEMNSSQTAAKTVALQSLGYKVPIQWVVAAVEKGSPAEGILQENDVLKRMILPDGSRHDLESGGPVLFEVLSNLEANTHLVLDIERNSKQKQLQLVTAPNPTRKGSRLGIYTEIKASFPVNIDFQLHNVGGPSAGTMFALGIVEELTKENLTGEHTIAGTGTLSLDGKVGPIAGIKQKMNAALRDGAEYFLAPEDNCNDVVGNIPAGLSVHSIATFSQALDSLEQIKAGNAQSLPQCSTH